MGQAALLPSLSSLFQCQTPPLFSAFWSTFCVPSEARASGGSPLDSTLATLGQLSLAPHARSVQARALLPDAGRGSNGLAMHKIWT